MALRAAAAQRLGLGKSGTPGPQRHNYGVTVRFRVSLMGNNAAMLGKWSGCSGLGLSVKLDEHVQGGDYDSVVRLPQEVTYNQVTLERAITSLYSNAVYQWVSEVVAWVNGPASTTGARPKTGGGLGGGLGGSSAPVRDVKIEILSAQDHQTTIFAWLLRNALPVSWSGPTLNAKGGGDVATEKLVLNYDGIEVLGADSASAASKPKQSKAKGNNQSGNDGKLTLSLAPAQGGAGWVSAGPRLQFLYNPKKVSAAQSVNFDTSGLVGDRNDLLVKPGEMGITINDLRVDGEAEVKRAADLLFAWITPEDVAPGVGGAAGSDTAAKPSAKKTTAKPGAKAKAAPKKKAKLLNVIMGTSEAIKFTVKLQRVDVNYVRFTRSGNPCRATITLTLQRFVELPGSTNPTSGTPEPGRIRVLTAGESLPGIATEVYGRPSAWRGVAENNGIDDPLRVRNGRRVVLPGVS